MNFTNTLNISPPPSFLSRKTPSRVLCPKTVRNAYQTLAPWERTSPVTNTGGQEAKARQLYNVNIIPSFAVRASSNTKWDRKSFLGVRQLFFSWPPQIGCTFWISFWSLQCFFSRNVCRMREQLCQIDHSDSIAWMPSRGSLVYVFATSHSLDALLTISSRSWPMPCASTKPSHIFTSTATRLAMRESRPGGRPRGQFGGPSKSSRSNGSISVVPQVKTCNRDEFGAQSK